MNKRSDYMVYITLSHRLESWSKNKRNRVLLVKNCYNLKEVTDKIHEKLKEISQESSFYEIIKVEKLKASVEVI